jgi:hypothetical protein
MKIIYIIRLLDNITFQNRQIQLFFQLHNILDEQYTINNCSVYVIVLHCERSIDNNYINI